MALPRWLGWLAVGVLLATLAIRLALSTSSATSEPLGQRVLPPVPPEAWLKPPPATQPPPQEIPRLPLTIVGSLRHAEERHTILVLDTPEGQRVVGEGERVTDSVTLEAITPDGLILDHQGRRERLPWPEPSAPPLMFDTE
ncbi:hypothetical protein KG088_05780 [Halomonas sp. TRM85114]|uniref:type II secretion system protein N n=1 Tax=Halomonas jincaotanensis TaxID=2810616 RepID=UPI001BD3D503|nr:type II secretion system protein N [Halomonas jincaotanensis]MBS9403134.1 hypothetical protein [Halomonas jincaotanensis]